MVFKNGDGKIPAELFVSPSIQGGILQSSPTNSCFNCPQLLKLHCLEIALIPRWRYSICAALKDYLQQRFGQWLLEWKTHFSVWLLFILLLKILSLIGMTAASGCSEHLAPSQAAKLPCGWKIACFHFNLSLLSFPSTFEWRSLGNKIVGQRGKTDLGNRVHQRKIGCFRMPPIQKWALMLC